VVVLTASAEGKLFNDRSPSERTEDLFWVGQDEDGVRLEACTRRVTGFELAVEDNGGIGEFLSWQAELGAKENLGRPAPGQGHEAHAFFEVAVAGQDAECAQHPVNARLLFLPSDLVTCCLIGADVQHQGEADLFPGKSGELWASLW